MNANTKRRLLAILSLLILPASAQAATTASTTSNDYMEFPAAPTGSVTGFELLLDTDFKAGFEASPVCANDGVTTCLVEKPYALKLPGSSVAHPPWSVSQLGSSHPLSAGEATALHAGLGWANNAKSLSVFPDKRVQLATNGETEYDGAYLKDWNTRKWVHLLLGQNMGAPGPYGRPTGSLADMTKLQFNADMHLLYNNQNRKKGFDPTRYTSQFVMYFTVQNLEKGHPGFGQYVWLGVPLFDDNNEGVDGEPMVDSGTSALIYTVPYKKVSGGKISSGAWVNFNGNILPSAKAAVEAGFSRGLLKTNDLKSYFIGGMNTGYESGALNIITMELKNLSLKVDASTLYPANGLYRDLNSLSESNPAKADPKPAETKPVPQAVGFFRVDGGDAVYYSNGDDAFCGYPSAESFFKSGGAKDFSNVTNRVGGLPAMRNDGACAIPADTVAVDTTTGAATVAEPERTPASAKAPAHPEGFFRVDGGDGVFYSNGNDAYCVYPSAESFFAAGGATDFSNVSNRVGGEGTVPILVEIAA